MEAGAFEDKIETGDRPSNAKGDDQIMLCDRNTSKIEYYTTSTPQDTGFYECLADNKFSIDRRGFIAKYELN